MTDYVLTDLAKRRAELVTEAKAADTRLAELLADIDHVDATIRLYDPAYKPRRVALRRSRNGCVARVVLEVLRKAQAPMTTRQIALAVMEANRQDMTDRRLVADRKDKVHAALVRQRKSGVVRAEERLGVGLVWEVAR